MSDAPQVPSLLDAQPGKPSRPPKPSFEQFLVGLRAAAAKPPRGGLPEVRRILNRGFIEKQNSHLVAQVAEILKAYPAADRWAALAAVAEIAGKLKRFQQQLLAEVRSHFARQIGFYELDVDGPGFKQRIEDWFLHSAPRRKSQPQQDAPAAPPTSAEPLPQPSTREMPFDSWLRWAFVCVLSKSSAERRMEGVLTLMELWARNANKNIRESQHESEWYRFIASVLGAEKPKSSRMAPVLNALHPLRNHLTGVLNRELTLCRDLAATRDEVAAQKQAEAAARRDLTDAQATIEEQIAQGGKLKQHLADAEERYRLLDDHWKRSSATNLARKIGGLRQEMGHEVQEAILSLGRDAPNVGMALNRLRRLEGIIKRQAAPEEDDAN